MDKAKKMHSILHKYVRMYFQWTLSKWKKVTLLNLETLIAVIIKSVVM